MNEDYHRARNAARTAALLEERLARRLEELHQCSLEFDKLPPMGIIKERIKTCIESLEKFAQEVPKFMQEFTNLQSKHMAETLSNVPCQLTELLQLRARHQSAAQYGSRILCQYNLLENLVEAMASAGRLEELDRMGIQHSINEMLGRHPLGGELPLQMESNRRFGKLLAEIQSVVDMETRNINDVNDILKDERERHSASLSRIEQTLHRLEAQPRCSDEMRASLQSMESMLQRLETQAGQADYIHLKCICEQQEKAISKLTMQVEVMTHEVEAMHKKMQNHHTQEKVDLRNLNEEVKKSNMSQPNAEQLKSIQQGIDEITEQLRGMHLVVPDETDQRKVEFVQSDFDYQGEEEEETSSYARKLQDDIHDLEREIFEREKMDRRAKLRTYGQGGLKERDAFLKCPYCMKKGVHYADNCTEYPTVQERIAILKKRGLCTVCLQYCRRTDCTRKGAGCYYCHSTSHHTSLCEEPENAEYNRQELVRAKKALWNIRKELEELEEKRPPKRRRF